MIIHPTASRTDVADLAANGCARRPEGTKTAAAFSAPAFSAPAFSEGETAWPVETSSTKIQSRTSRSLRKPRCGRSARSPATSSASPRCGLALRQVQGQDRARLHSRTARAARRQADPRHRDHPDPGRRRQDDDHGRARRRAQPDRQESDAVPARSQHGPVLRRQGRGGRRRLCPGRADGGHQPPFYRRYPRDRRRQQPARGDGRQPHLLRARTAHRSAPGQLAPRHRHERPGVALDRRLARRGRQRLSARGWVRHHRRLPGDGDFLPGDRPARPAAPAWQHRRRPDARAQAGDRRRGQGRRIDDRALEGRARPQPGADASSTTRSSSMAARSPTSPMAATR